MLSRSKRKLIRSLGRRKGREDHGLFLVEGPRLLPELLASPVEPVLVACVPGSLAAREDLRDRARERGAEWVEISDSELEELSDTETPQGVLAAARVPRRGEEVLDAASLLAFDGVQDPGNLGTLLRTAEALGVGGAISLPGTVDTWNPKAIRASAGSAFRLPVLSMGREEAVEALRRRGTRIWAADVEGVAVDRWETPPARLALVLGNEGSGVSQEILRDCDRRVRVAVSGRVESLNVAVAGALLLDRIFGGRSREP